MLNDLCEPTEKKRDCWPMIFFHYLSLSLIIYTHTKLII
jgi:hypothetical protein